MQGITIIALLACSAVLLACSRPQAEHASMREHIRSEHASGEATAWTDETDTVLTAGKVVKSEEEWRRQLSQMEYYVTREAGTERAFTGKYWDHKENGIYACVCCGQQLFASDTKFKSGTGWPSFYEPVVDTAIAEKSDFAYGMFRTEVICSRCDAHLGHVFADGPEPTGLRYCINSASLDFIPAKK